MSQILINVLAWLIIHAGISVSELPVFDEIGFNQPVACQFDFQENREQSTVLPAVNRREQLRGVLMIVQLPAPIQNVARPAISTKAKSPRPQIRWIINGASSVERLARKSLIQISDWTFELSNAVQEFQSRSVAGLVHRFNGQFETVSRISPRAPAASRFWGIDWDRIVERVQAASSRLSFYATDNSDSYWTYYQDCDRWGVVLKRIDHPSRQSAAVVDIDAIARSAANQIQLALPILVPGSTELGLLNNNRNDILELSRSAMEWWQLVIFNAIRPSISRIFESRMIW